MDPVQFVWLMGIGALVGGGIIGAIAYRNLAPARKEASNLKAELDQARDEMESYKASVNSHFDKTSELVNELTQDYVKVYKHLAEGAQVLGDGREFTHVLEQHQGKVLISVDGDSGKKVSAKNRHASGRQKSVMMTRYVVIRLIAVRWKTTEQNSATIAVVAQVVSTINTHEMTVVKLGQ